jgi:hypothetical protein
MLDAAGVEYECTDPVNTGVPANFVWVSRPPAGTPTTPIAAGQIVFGGTAGALTSSARLKFVDATGEGQPNALRVSDGTQLVMYASADRADTGFGGRGFYVMGFNGGVMLEVANWNPAAGFFSRSLTVYTETGQPCFSIDALAAEQQWNYSTSLGNAVFFWTDATKDSIWYDDSGNVDAAAQLFRIDHTTATPKLQAKRPLTHASYTVAALPSPPPGGAGSVAWASNGRKTGEGGGAGTGVLVGYSSAGPAGAGWYPVGLNAALVTA